MYYPKSQITPNLYTAGNEYQFFTTKQKYTGYYYKVSSGKLYTGKNPQDGPNSLLIPIQELNDAPNSPEGLSENPITLNNSVEPGYENYISLDFSEYPNNPNFVYRNLPHYSLTLPTDQEKSLGIFSRYFCKKNNELLYTEINKQTFTLLKKKDPKIAWDLYSPIVVLWQIKGDKEKTYLANRNNVRLIESRQKWYGFHKYFKEDFLKYYVGT